MSFDWMYVDKPGLIFPNNNLNGWMESSNHYYLYAESNSATCAPYQPFDLAYTFSDVPAKKNSVAFPRCISRTGNCLVGRWKDRKVKSNNLMTYIGAVFFSLTTHPERSYRNAQHIHHNIYCSWFVWPSNLLVFKLAAKRYVH